MVGWMDSPTAAAEFSVQTRMQIPNLKQKQTDGWIDSPTAASHRNPIPRRMSFLRTVDSSSEV